MTENRPPNNRDDDRREYGRRKAYDFEITADTVLDSDHQPEEGDPIEVEYKEENGKLIAVKATVTSGK